MANGDAAAAAGLPVVPGTKDVRLGFDDINALADAVAAHMVSGGHKWSKISEKPERFPTDWTIVDGRPKSFHTLTPFITVPPTGANAASVKQIVNISSAGFTGIPTFQLTALNQSDEFAAAFIILSVLAISPTSVTIVLRNMDVANRSAQVYVSAFEGV